MTNMTVPSLLPPPHHTTVVHIAVHDRAAADLRGAAGRAPSSPTPVCRPARTPASGPAP